MVAGYVTKTYKHFILLLILQIIYSWQIAMANNSEHSLNPFNANPTEWSKTPNLSAICRRIVWVCLTILWGFKGLIMNRFFICMAFQKGKKRKTEFETRFCFWSAWFLESSLIHYSELKRGIWKTKIMQVDLKVF